MAVYKHTSIHLVSSQQLESGFALCCLLLSSVQHQQVLTDCHARRCSSGPIVDADATCKVIGDARSSRLSVPKNKHVVDQLCCCLFLG